MDTVLQTPPSVLVIGTGYYGRMRVPQETRETLLARSMELRELKTRYIREISLEAEHVLGATVLRCSDTPAIHCLRRYPVVSPG